MAFEQSFQEPTLHFESNGDVPLKQKWKSIPVPSTASDDVNRGFDCNICLDSAHDPVVTLCGHLYCWPCIYKWLQVQSSSSESSQEKPKCPICKSKISRSSLVPLYGRGTSSSESDSKKNPLDLIIPRRPPALGAHTLVTSMTSHPNHHLHSNPSHFHPQQFLPRYPYGNYASIESSNRGGSSMASVFRPTAGMFGDMVFARMFGSSDTSLFSYPYHQNSHPIIRSGSPRIRRQVHRLNSVKTRDRIDGDPGEECSMCDINVLCKGDGPRSTELHEVTELPYDHRIVTGPPNWMRVTNMLVGDC